MTEQQRNDRIRELQDQLDGALTDTELQSRIEDLQQRLASRRTSPSGSGAIEC